LISADVEVELVLELTKKLENKVKKAEEGLTKKETLVKELYDELLGLLGEKNFGKIPEPKKILLLGLFGSGKTTTAGKLAKFYLKRGKKVGLIQSDVDRPAAYEQLKQLGEKIKVPVFYEKGLKSEEIVEKGLEEFKDCDLIIVDTAGRDALDKEMTEQIKKIDKVLKADLKLLVIQADLGQIAGRQAKSFQDSVGLNGVILTKTDGSAKGGGALSACKHTGAKVYFIGTGEKLDDFEIFDVNRYVSRLLGYADLRGLLEKIKEIEEEGEFDLGDLAELREMNFETYRKQMRIMKKFGSINKLLEMLGLADKMPKEIAELGEEKIRKYSHIIDSMTKEERLNPDLIKGNRIKRIATGSGNSENDVRELVKNFEKMKTMVKNFKGMSGGRGQIAQIQKMMKKFGFDPNKMKM
jgi:signal recognition particle subunit SRP54